MELWKNYDLSNDDHATILLENHAPNFERWWDPNKFNWKNLTNFRILCSRYYHKFEIWWNPNKFRWKDNLFVDILTQYCVHKFDIWWDPERFDWHDSSSVSSLIQQCSDKFDIWWNPEKIVKWKEAFEYLTVYCPDYFRKWWDPDKFVVSSESLRGLIRYCYSYFDDWWDAIKDKLEVDEGFLCLLSEHCPDKINIWLPYVAKKYKKGYFKDLRITKDLTIQLLENYNGPFKHISPFLVDNIHKPAAIKKLLEKYPTIKWVSILEYHHPDHPFLLAIKYLTESDLKKLKTKLLLGDSNDKK